MTSTASPPTMRPMCRHSPAGGASCSATRRLRSSMDASRSRSRKAAWWRWSGGDPSPRCCGGRVMMVGRVTREDIDGPIPSQSASLSVQPLKYSLLYLDSTKTREAGLTLGARWIRVWWMIRPGFLSAAERGALIVVARDGLVEHRVARRANAIVLLNDGWNCEEVGSALLLDDDTVREWFGVYQRQGMAGLRNFGHEGSSCQLTDEQQTALKAFVTMRLPRSTNAIGAWLRKEVGSALLLDDDTVRECFGVYQRQGMAGLRNFGHEGSSCQLTDEQQTALKAFVTMRLPRSTNAIGAWLRKNYELSHSYSWLAWIP